jgi:AraC-like DNA-binding protein
MTVGEGEASSCNWSEKLISVRTTEFRGSVNGAGTFESNMFSQTNAFALTNELGRVRVDTAELRSDGPRISRVLSTGHVVDLTEDKAVTVLVPASGQLRVRVGAAEYKVTQRSVCIFGPTARRTRTEAPRSAALFRADALMIPLKRLRDLMRIAHDRDLPWSDLPDGLPAVATRPDVLRLTGILAYVTNQFDDELPISARSAAAMATLIEDCMADILFGSVEGLRDDRAVSASMVRVRMAEEIMRARSDEPLSMAEVAREVGVGLRSLQLAFMDVRAMGPRDVLLQMRLERAHDRLCHAGPSDTVTSIALDCGFAHLGRFPAAYRIAFGELPADTLARSRRRFS